LNWFSVPSATGYNIKRATSSAGPFELAAPTVATTNYTDTGLLSGTSYYYVVSALNSGGAGPDSEPVAATPLPPLLTIFQVGVNVRFSWPASATGFALQEAPLLSGDWTNSSVVVQLQGTDSVAELPIEQGTKFYRLIQ
jgi:hypothetical protein